MQQAGAEVNLENEPNNDEIQNESAPPDPLSMHNGVPLEQIYKHQINSLYKRDNVTFINPTSI